MNVGGIAGQQLVERDAKAGAANGNPGRDILSTMPKVLFQKILELAHPHNLNCSLGWNRHFNALSQSLLVIPTPLQARPQEIAEYDRPEFRRHHFERENKNAEYEVQGSFSESIENYPYRESPQLDPARRNAGILDRQYYYGQCGKIALCGNDNILSLVHCETGEILRAIFLEGHSGDAVPFSERMFVTATGGEQGQLALWELGQPNPLITKALRTEHPNAGRGSYLYPMIYKIYKVGNCILLIGRKAPSDSFIKCFAYSESAGKNDADRKVEREFKETANLKHDHSHFGEKDWQVRVLKDYVFTITNSDVNAYQLEPNGLLTKRWSASLRQIRKQSFVANVNLYAIVAINPLSVAVSDRHVAIQVRGLAEIVTIFDSTTGKVVKLFPRMPFFRQMWLRGDYLLGIQENEYSVTQVNPLRRSQVRPWTLHVMSIPFRKHFYVTDFEQQRQLDFPTDFTKQIWVLGQHLVISLQLTNGSFKEKMFRLHLPEQDLKERAPELPRPRLAPVVAPPVAPEADRKDIAGNGPAPVVVPVPVPVVPPAPPVLQVQAPAPGPVLPPAVIRPISCWEHFLDLLSRIKACFQRLLCCHVFVGR